MTAFLRSRSSCTVIFFLLIAAITPARLQAQELSFQHAVELAMQRSGTMAIAAADRVMPAASPKH